MKKVKIGIFLALILLLAFSVFAAQIGSSNYNQNVIVSTGGENASSSSYKTSIAVNIINGIISSASYINSLGFFYTWKLADNQPCTTASQCEGNFCCSSLCKSSACPSEAAGGGGGGAGGAAGGGGGGVIEEVKDFSISPGSIKEQLVLGAAKVKTITIRNTGTADLDFKLDVATVNDMVFLSEESFALEPGQEKTIEANMIGKRLGSYIGEIEVTGDGTKKSIDIVIEVESEQVLFDVKIDIPSAYKEIAPGEDLKAQITLFNVGPSKKVDVTPTYIIKDRQGNTIYESSETFAVERQSSYVKSFKLPKTIKPGDYLAIVELRYENSFAVSSELFRVVQREAIIQKAVKSNMALLSGLFVFVGLMFLFVYTLMPKIRIFKTAGRCMKAINNANESIQEKDLLKAREFYQQARNIYLDLEADGKREVYDKLMDLHSQIRQLAKELKIQKIRNK